MAVAVRRSAERLGRHQTDAFDGLGMRVLEGIDAVGLAFAGDKGIGMVGVVELVALRHVEHPQLPEQGTRPARRPVHMHEVLLAVERIALPARRQGVRTLVLSPRLQAVLVAQVGGTVT
jgi:hypothetical protein